MDNFDLKKYLYNNPLLKEIKINNPNATDDDINDILYNIMGPIWDGDKGDLRYREEWNKLRDELSDKYNLTYWDEDGIDGLENLTQSDLNIIYYKLNSFKSKENNISEIKINNPNTYKFYIDDEDNDENYKTGTLNINDKEFYFSFYSSYNSGDVLVTFFDIGDEEILNHMEELETILVKKNISFEKEKEKEGFRFTIPVPQSNFKLEFIES